ncbi:MAG: DNA polymerase III subunit beta [Cetobacterium sp.]|nr:DNA polymerase III subunit beta [Cetobacterium sp.]
MILKVNRVEFLKRLRIAEKAISDNKIRPIISCVYLEAKNNEIFFCGTNLELTINTTMVCEILEEGKVVFQHQLVDEYLKEISDEFVTLNVKENSLIIETEDSSSEFAIMDAEDFPKINKDFSAEPEMKFSITKEELTEVFEKIKFSASVSSDNLSINCIRLEIEENKMRFISTDTYRLTFLEKEIEAQGNLTVSIPLNTVEALSKLLKGNNENEIEFFFENKQLYFYLDDVLVISRVIDLPFPNYRGILGGVTYTKRIFVNSEEMTKMLKRIQIFVRNNTESKFGAIFELKKNILEIRGVNDIAKVKETLEIDYQGEPMKISLNVKFLLDFIQNIPKDQNVSLELTNSNSAVRVKDLEEENYIYIVMPLALRDC